MDELRVRSKRVGKTTWVLPACKQSRKIAKALGVLTLTPVAVKALIEMGFEVKDLEEIEVTQRAIAAKYDPEDTVWEEETKAYRVQRKRLLPSWLIPYLHSTRANRAQQQTPQKEAKK